MDMIYCKGCGKAIKMIHLEGRSTTMPVDCWPVRCVEDGGSRLLLVNEDGTTFRGREVDRMCREARLAYKPHWISCPNPPARRKKPPRDKPTRRPDVLSGTEAILAAAREREARRRAEEEAERARKRLLAEREREWAERQTKLF